MSKATRRTKLWSLDYIESAAIARTVIRRIDGSIVDPDASNYDPPSVGVHLCGQTDDGQQPTTIASYAMTPGEARQKHALAKAVAECSEDEADFVVDLAVGQCGIVDDFFSNRQLWPRAIEAWNSGAAS